jgi:hypothetical protein
VKPGDLVRINYHRDGGKWMGTDAFVGKTGLIVKTVRPSPVEHREIFEVLVDGHIRNFHQSYLESIDETG